MRAFALIFISVIDLAQGQAANAKATHSEMFAPVPPPSVWLFHVRPNPTSCHTFATLLETAMPPIFGT